MQPSFASSGSPEATAWPHAGKGRKHVLQLSVGAPPAEDKDGGDFAKLKEVALTTLAEAPAKITGRSSHPPGEFLPNFLLENHDPSKVFATNWDKLRKVKRRYDKNGRFNKGFFIQPAEAY